MITPHATDPIGSIVNAIQGRIDEVFLTTTLSGKKEYNAIVKCADGTRVANNIFQDSDGNFDAEYWRRLPCDFVICTVTIISTDKIATVFTLIVYGPVKKERRVHIVQTDNTSGNINTRRILNTIYGDQNYLYVSSQEFQVQAI